MNNKVINFSLYNNEVIAMMTIAEFLKYNGISSYTKIFLILPFILHNETLVNLKKKNYRSLDEIFIKETSLFANFNKRFDTFFNLSFTSILLLEELGIISFIDEGIIYNKNTINFDEIGGKRYIEICKAIGKLIIILNDEDAKLYLQLNIQLGNSQ